MPVPLVVGMIGKRILAEIAKNHVLYLQNLYSTLQSIQGAPLEIRELRSQVELLSICAEKFCEALIVDDSVIDDSPSEHATALEKCLTGCMTDLGLVMDIIMKYTATVEGGGQAWTDTFKRLYKTFCWTKQKGSIQDLIAKIQRDIEVITKISTAIQNKKISDLQSVLSQVADDTHHIRQKVDEMSQAIGLIHHLLIGLGRGSQDSLNGMFGSDEPGDDGDGGPPPYTPNLNTGIRRNFIQNTRFRTSNEQQWQVVPQDQPSTLRVSTAEFLWRMAKVAADVHPWDKKIRSSSRYAAGSSDKALYDVVCHLMAITQTQKPWDNISVSSFLTAGAWYLSQARFRLTDSRKGPSSLIEIYASFVKVYWIVMTIDQHPNKPSKSNTGGIYRELEQYQNLIKALYNEIANAELLLKPHTLQVMASQLRKNMGTIWERKTSADSLIADHAVGLYGLRILELASTSQSYLQTTTAGLIGQWDVLCPNTCISLPQAHEYTPPQPTILGCMCARSEHLQQLKQYYVTRESYAETGRLDELSLEIHNVAIHGEGGKPIVIAIECPDQPARESLKQQLLFIVGRLNLLQLPGFSCDIGSFHGEEAFRLVRSPFDYAKIGEKKTAAMRSIEPPKRFAVEIEVEEKRRVPKPNPTIFSGFWSALTGLEQFDYETVKKKKMIWKETAPEDPKPLKKTEVLIISPLTLCMYNFWDKDNNMRTTAHVISTTSCFELWFELDSAFNMERVAYSTAVSLKLPPGTNPIAMANEKMMQATIIFQTPQELESFQQSALLARANKKLGYAENLGISALTPRKIVWGPKQIRSCGSLAVKSRHSSGKTQFCLFGSKVKGKDVVGMIWDTSNMMDVAYFEVDMKSTPITMPSRTNVTSFQLKVIGAYQNEDRRASYELDKNTDRRVALRDNATMTITTSPLSFSSCYDVTDSIELETSAAEDALEIRSCCEGEQIQLVCFIERFQFTPKKSFGVRKSSKSQDQYSAKEVVVQLYKTQDGRRRLDVWLPDQVSSRQSEGFWRPERGPTLTYICPSDHKTEFGVIGNFLHVNKGEMMYCEASKYGWASNRWNGDFELHFQDANDATQLIKALIYGSVERTVVVNVEGKR